MFKPKTAPIVLLLSILLAACRGTPQATETPSVDVFDPTSVPTVQVATPEVVASGPATCTVISQASDQVSEIEKMFAPVTEADWINGPDTASVTIIEYSDFQ